MSAPVAEGDVVLDKFRVERVLGQGGMGIVVAATHVELDQKVALKFLLPDALAHPELVERFAREAKAAARIQSQHVVRVLDTGKMPNGAPFMVMEYLEGRDLDDTLNQEGPLTPAIAIDYLLQACEAVGEAHSAGIVHRDLKPSNLFLAKQRDRRAIVKVLDFGISKVEDPKAAPLTRTATMMGSPLYMSPEQLTSSKDVDARSDIWALGVILYELVSGKRPFDAETMPEVVAQILRNQPQPLSTVRPDVPADLERVVARCLSSEPKSRFQSVAELANALSPFAGDTAAASASAARISRVLGHNSLAPSPPSGATIRTVPSHERTEVAPTPISVKTSNEPAPSGVAATVAMVQTAPAVAIGQTNPDVESPPPARPVVPLVAGAAVVVGVVGFLAIRALSAGPDPQPKGAALVATTATATVIDAGTFVATASASAIVADPTASAPVASAATSASSEAKTTNVVPTQSAAPPAIPPTRATAQATVKVTTPPPATASAATTSKSPLNMGIK